MNNLFTTVARDSAPWARHLARMATFSPSRRGTAVSIWLKNKSQVGGGATVNVSHPLLVFDDGWPTFLVPHGLVKNLLNEATCMKRRGCLRRRSSSAACDRTYS